MKSAYELAMERLAKSDPEHAPRALSESEKRALAGIESRYQAKLAGRELFGAKPTILKPRTCCNDPPHHPIWRTRPSGER